MRYFEPELFRFLTQLRAHNDRDWFLANKERFETAVRAPFLRFIADLAPRLKKVSPYVVVVPKAVGGSLMRINRDIRFSRDKSPYKTGMGAHFRHAKGEEGGAPAFYLHLEPDKSMVGAGVWRPEPGALEQIRDAIAKDPTGWERARAGRPLGAGCTMMGESLKRPPAGYPPDHRFIEDLKRKDFGMGAPIKNADVTSPKFLELVVAGYRKSAPFMRFLSKAEGLPF